MRSTCLIICVYKERLRQFHQMSLKRKLSLNQLNQELINLIRKLVSIYVYTTNFCPQYTRREHQNNTLIWLQKTITNNRGLNNIQQKTQFLIISVMNTVTMFWLCSGIFLNSVGKKIAIRIYIFRQTKSPLIVANRLTESAHSQRSFTAFLCTLSKTKEKYLVRIENIILKH